MACKIISSEGGLAEVLAHESTTLLGPLELETRRHVRYGNSRWFTTSSGGATTTGKRSAPRH